MLDLKRLESRQQLSTSCACHALFAMIWLTHAADTICSSSSPFLSCQSLLYVYCLCLARYTSRLHRLKRQAGETLALWEDEFEEQLTPEDFGFVDPSSCSESDGGSENNPRPGTGGGNGLDATETCAEGEDGDAAVTVAEGDNALLVGGGGAGVAEGSGTAVAEASSHASVPVPHPMDVEEPQWDEQGDCVPLPPWKVFCIEKDYTRMSSGP